MAWSSAPIRYWSIIKIIENKTFLFGCKWAQECRMILDKVKEFSNVFENVHYKSINTLGAHDQAHSKSNTIENACSQTKSIIFYSDSRCKFLGSELSAGKLARQRWAIISQARLICCCCCEREKRSTHTGDHGHKSWALLIWLAPQRFDPVGTILSLPHNGDDEKNLVVCALGGFFSANSRLKSEKSAI